MSLLDVNGLGVRYADKDVVSGLSFGVGSGESVGLVGESGSGKTQTALAIMGLLPGKAAISGSIDFAGTEIVGASERQLNTLRAERIGMVFQDPMQALNPYVPIGKQLRRVLLRHGISDGREVDQRVMHMLDRVGLPDPARQFRAYAHQLSGGMRQRVMIASALLAQPDLLIADEPTTALDVTVQAQILELLERIREETALLLITHDLGIIAGHCERLVVIEAGRLVEEGPTRKLFSEPRASHTRKLIDAAPRLDGDSPPAPESAELVLEADNVSVSYAERNERLQLHAVMDLDLQLQAGETVAVVGESGSGKSSFVRAVLGLVPMRAGRVTFCGQEVAGPLQARSIETRRDLQLVFQDPAGSLNPQLRIERIIAEPLTVHAPELDAKARSERVADALQRVGLDEDLLGRFPHQLSGGQAQRVAIARALIVNPRVLVCDEAVAALDGSVRQQVLNLLHREQQATGLAIVFISHDLAVVRSISHRVMVLYLGRLVELADGAGIFRHPRHPYTRALLDAVPVPDPLAPGGRLSISGEVPSIIDPPSGCAFHPRCRYAEQRCRVELPLVRPVGEARVACHRAEELEL
ncbi:MAG: ABC transporter ATP-binding protein [Gammaproteobacteria bacterium]|jgi:peptide/nickel transport system ATP-binding protein|nr:ABC transporter ATP-binding protein [Gammaproteobacteria bacterium]MDH3863065.1 ABC transporter ATP-binding protein [Gammaproteobacteria bacterium]NCF60948.1 dipeptide ABC transporter ATP-binding protein [Gammaproteobacteria bacterium]